MIGKWLRKKHKRALYEALEKIKSELMLLGFISLLLTVGQGLILDICISKEIAATCHPCNKKQENSVNESDEEDNTDTEHRRRLLAISNPGGVFRRSLARASDDKCAAQVHDHTNSND
ncbi:MILDEW RESISTANCE LOCUS O 6 [Hibiscus trionum]|uniref:MILDEW RESISTANCE LOCUS O 6 n=1 Tax=Hibiscus trionum TaxID=183268 RepID=A0A9W7GY64_HIBTR|nr:MILDEW RESISTANCE LOCUS O 6 [Hibiscus trionum]